MRLQHFSPPIQNELVQALQGIGIRTDTDLLLSEDPTRIFTRLQQDLGISLLDFRRAVAKVAELASATHTYGDRLLEQELKRQEDDVFADDMRVGVPTLDALLGGFSPPRVIEVSGDKGSGKTALALQLALRHLAQVNDSSVLWIDSNGEFSPERVSTMLEKMDGEVSLTILERLQVSLAFDIEAVHEVLETLRQTLSSRSSYSELPTTRCIVIDSITPLLGSMLSATSSQGHAIMTTFMRQLRAFADSFLLTILVINSSTKILPSNPETVFETARKPALGPSFTFMADATLWLSQRPPEEPQADDDSTMHVAEVLRSRISVRPVIRFGGTVLKDPRSARRRGRSSR
ncbi:P-loop containing nucleoside triphosphate hydrolase protein [Trametes versicolor FP-101664 SS1]|uniref:P-loop containing nucleoside triphosphate hydrolase protein n=1 Tax=Trametes versicolor (strain FP-101664) TaxID=717944 RepID=UPI000462135F|nr:P-loop containing nucleoside triphosphate hydrolase protein [Trametes versicolor FP-101664 SS1]EIW57144.1 P-loop containing nucleoside triphosphate hydrolase protein [Trametes versicolor FP-101664 SS1]